MTGPEQELEETPAVVVQAVAASATGSIGEPKENEE